MGYCVTCTAHQPPRMWNMQVEASISKETIQKVFQNTLLKFCKVTTACEEDERDDVRAAFKKIQETFASQGMQLTYKMLEIADEMPHFRRIQIRSDGKRCSLWLDRRLDIFRFDNLRKSIVSTLETYIVVEQ